MDLPYKINDRSILEKVIRSMSRVVWVEICHIEKVKEKNPISFG